MFVSAAGSLYEMYVKKRKHIGQLIQSISLCFSERGVFSDEVAVAQIVKPSRKLAVILCPQRYKKMS